MGQADEGLLHTVIFCVACSWVVGAENGTGGCPECSRRHDKLDECHCNLLYISFCGFEVLK
jgi:hypothetical protein